LERDSAEQQAALLGGEGEVAEGNGFHNGGMGSVYPCLHSVRGGFCRQRSLIWI
jgi:hypothetical protein